ncbi:MAG: carboxypeptidase regulatory-like domain-containing protein [Sedimentisphaerales bacterium]|nr:carboxypeptidase regulatory-like domain-containing protein [Sedimentisphaerales bacterium]
MKTFKLIIAFVCFCLYGYSPAKENQMFLVEGQVVDYMARPVEGAEVAIYEKEYRNGEEYANLIASVVKADRSGKFVLHAKVSTQYGTFIVARKKGLALAWDGLNYSNNTKGKGHFLLVLEKACTVTGTVVDPTGKPVSAAKVQALPVTSYMSRLNQRPIMAPKEWFTTETDPQGMFRFNQFSADVSCDFWVKASQLGSIYKFTTHDLSACGFEVWRSDIRLVLPREGNIKGRVVEVGTNHPVGDVELTVKADRDREDILNRYRTRTIKVDANAVFECSGLAEGKHKIELNTPPNETARWIAKPVEVNVVPDRLKDDVTVRVEKGGLIECKVRELGTKHPLAGICVSIYGEAGWASVSTNEMGTAELRIPPGEYRGHVSGQGYIAWRINTPIITKTGEITNLDVQLEKSRVLTGSVVDSNGQPARDVLVILHPFGDQIYTDEQGRFAAGYDENDAKQGIYVMARDLKRSLAALVLTNEFKKPVQLILGPALTVKGKIIDPNGIGIPAARVSLVFNFAQCGAEVLTDSQGGFGFDAIPPIHSDDKYYMSVNTAGYGPKGERVTIEGQPGATVEVQAIPLVTADVSISGTVVDANGLPAARVPIFLHDEAGLDQPDKTTATSENGQFAFHRICKGPLRLQANFDSSPGGAGFLYAQGGDKDVKIILGQENTHQPYVSLIQKPLPELKNIGIDLPSAKTKGKNILFCFWDMNQRPSRHCMNLIIKQADSLKPKDVIIIAVQASKIDEETLNQWKQKKNVPFPVGMISDDVEKTRIAWGVQSLPWLVLTNNQHIVIDAGFGINELSEKIEAAR